MVQIAFFLMAKSLTVSDQKLEISSVRRVDMREVKFIDNTLAEREPNVRAARMGGIDSVLGARSPARFNTGCPKGDY